MQSIRVIKNDHHDISYENVCLQLVLNGNIVSIVSQHITGNDENCTVCKKKGGNRQDINKNFMLDRVRG